MALVRVDSTGESTTTTGTGTVTLSGSAVTGFRTFSAASIANGSTVRYRIQDAANTEWETGEGTYNSGTGTVSRDTVYASSNAGSLVNFSAGTKAVIVVMTAADFGSFAASAISFTPAGTIAATDVQAAIQELDSEKQAYSANLDEYAAVNPTAAGLALLDDADAAAQRTTLGLAIGTDVQAYDAQLASLATLSYTGNASKVVRVNAGETAFELATVSSGGSGDVVGPASATDNAIVRFDSTTGKLVQNSAVTIADTTGSMAFSANATIYSSGTLDVGNSNGSWKSDSYIMDYFSFGTAAQRLAGSYHTVTRGGGFLWSENSSNVAATPDTAMFRAAARTVKFTNGADDTNYADLKMRGIWFASNLTVATLPSAASYEGMIYRVSDANAPSVGATVASGGSTKCTVQSDATNWKVIFIA